MLRPRAVLEDYPRQTMARSALFRASANSTESARQRAYLCLSKISKCLSHGGYISFNFLHNSRRCSFLSRQSSQLCLRSSVRALLSGSRTWLCASKSVCFRGPPEIARKLTSGDHPLWICLSRLWRDWRSALAIVKPESVIAWQRAGFRLFLDLEGAARPNRTTAHFARGPRSDPQDVPGDSRLVCTPHPRRTAQTRHRHRGEQHQQIHGALPQTAISDAAHISGESRQATGLHRLPHGARDPFPAPSIVLVCNGAVLLFDGSSLLGSKPGGSQVMKPARHLACSSVKPQSERGAINEGLHGRTPMTRSPQGE
jgi:hypothetical protein